MQGQVVGGGEVAEGERGEREDYFFLFFHLLSLKLLINKVVDIFNFLVSRMSIFRHCLYIFCLEKLWISANACILYSIGNGKICTPFTENMAKQRWANSTNDIHKGTRKSEGRWRGG